MKSVFKWIVPNGVDRWLLALLILLVLAVMSTVDPFDSFGGAGRQLFRFAILTAAFCFPAVMGTRSWKDIRSSALLLLMALFAPLLILGQPDWHEIWYGLIDDKESPPEFADTKLPLLVYFASWFGVLVCAIGFSRVADKLLHAGADKRKQRLRMLLYFVFLLIACSVAQKYLDFLSTSHPFQRSMGSCLLFGILMIVATHLLAHQRRWWQMALVSIFLFFCTTILLLGEPRNLAGTAAFFVIQWLLWRPFSDHRDGVSKRAWPSLWGLAAFALSVVLVAASSLFDLGVIINSGGAASLQLARTVQQMKSQRGVDANIISSAMTWNGSSICSITIQTKFTPEANPEYFAGLAKISEPIELHLALEHLNPSIDLSHLRGRMLIHADMSNSLLSGQQLIELAHDCRYLYLKNCRMEPSELSPAANRIGLGPSYLLIFEMNANQVSLAAKALQVDGFSGTLGLSNCDLSDEDWRAIVDLKGAASISIQNCPLPSTAETASFVRTALQQPDAPTITGYARSSQEFWRSASINVGVYGQSMFDTDAETWDALFTGHWQYSPDSSYWEPWIGKPDFLGALKEFHLAFDSGGGSGVVIPGLNDKMIELAGTIPDLQVLSFEPLWFSSRISNQVAPDEPFPNLSPLRNLDQLRELYLPKGILLHDFSVFAGLPKLETLQFDAYHDTGIYRMPKVKAEWFPNLKKVMLFSEPHRMLLLELSKLEQLEVIEMLDGEEWFAQPIDREKFRNIFNDRVEIRFLDLKDYPNPPESFQRHLKRVRESIRERRFPSDLNAATDAKGEN